MKFKDDNLISQFKNAPASVKLVAIEFDKISRSIGVDPVCTRITDPVEGESGVHTDYRGLDFRDEFGPTRTYDQATADMIVSYMNIKFPRKDKFKTCIHHSFNGGPLHFHLQVPALSTSLLYACPYDLEEID